MKTRRDTLDRRIGRARTPQEKRWLAAFGRTGPLTGIARLVVLWRTVRHCRKARDKSKEFVALAEAVFKETSDYVISAMIHNRPDMLEALAKEMRQLDKTPEWQPDKLRHAMLVDAESATPNLSRIADRFNQDPSHLRRIKRGWKRKDS